MFERPNARSKAYVFACANGLFDFFNTWIDILLYIVDMEQLEEDCSNRGKLQTIHMHHW